MLANFCAVCTRQLTLLLLGRLTDEVFMLTVNFSICSVVMPQYAPAPCILTFDLLTLKVASESHVTLLTSVPILVFLGLSVFSS